ncbi:MAG: hypothetical protein WED33_07185 [Bacteroidia bacterium]
MKKNLLLVALCLPLLGLAQIPETVSNYKKTYLATVSETILSLGYVDSWTINSINGNPVNAPVSESVEPIPWFSAFFHLGEQIHVNFNNTFGFYTGFGIRNMGMINRLNDTIKVKQRVYSFGVPLAIKIGDMGMKRYAAFGAELEFFFNYKQKTFLGTGRGDKVEKFNEWVSDRTPLLNPSVFAEFCFGKGSYLKIRYYLADFLVPGKQSFKASGSTYNWSPQQSQLFAVSFGRVITKKRK